MERSCKTDKPAWLLQGPAAGPARVSRLLILFWDVCVGNTYYLMGNLARESGQICIEIVSGFSEKTKSEMIFFTVCLVVQSYILYSFFSL